jgi:hypothetical protein
VHFVASTGLRRVRVPARTSGAPPRPRHARDDRCRRESGPAAAADATVARTQDGMLAILLDDRTRREQADARLRVRLADPGYSVAENSSKPAGTHPGVLPSITSRATSTPRSTVSGL